MMDVLDHVAQCALRIELAAEDLESERRQLRLLIRRARIEGHTLAVIGESAGVSAQRIHQLEQERS